MLCIGRIDGGGRMTEKEAIKNLEYALENETTIDCETMCMSVNAL